MNEEIESASERSAHLALLRDAFIYSPLFVAGLVLTVLSVLGIVNAGIVLTIIEVLLTALFGYQGIQAIRDLRSEPVTIEGTIGRKWSKMDFVITRSHYIAVDRKIFRLGVVEWHFVEEEDQVRVLHYPHTGTVARLEQIPKAQRQQ